MDHPLNLSVYLRFTPKKRASGSLNRPVDCRIRQSLGSFVSSLFPTNDSDVLENRLARTSLSDELEDGAVVNSPSACMIRMHCYDQGALSLDERKGVRYLVLYHKSMCAWYLWVNLRYPHLSGDWTVDMYADIWMKFMCPWDVLPEGSAVFDTWWSLLFYILPAPPTWLVRYFLRSHLWKHSSSIASSESADNSLSETKHILLVWTRVLAVTLTSLVDVSYTTEATPTLFSDVQQRLKSGKPDVSDLEDGKVGIGYVVRNRF